MFKQEPLEPLYRNVRDKLKCGQLDNFRKDELREIDALIEARAASCPFAEGSLQSDFFKLQLHLHPLGGATRGPAANNPLYWKAVSISLEFRDYMEVLPSQSRARLERDGERILKEFDGPAPDSSTHGARELLKEKARLVSTYANQLWRDRQYGRAEDAIRSAKRVIRLGLRPKGMPCNTVLGALSYVKSKLLRHYGRYREAETRLTKAIDYYSSWVTDNAADPKNVRLASYKIASFLGAIAWCKNSRGFCTDALALVNAARLLILPTGWELDQAHLDMIYADVLRATAGAGTKRQQKAIAIVERCHRTFERLSHERMTSRAAFTSALLNYYANNLAEAQRRLRAAEDFSRRAGDEKWLVNCWNLRARIMLKQERPQGRPAEALSLLRKSINKANDGGLKNQLVVAYIVKGEAHARRGTYRKAVESLEEARRENEKRIGEGVEASIERNKGWILLSLAETHLLSGDVGQAKECLKQWEHLGGVELEWLREKAEGVAGGLAASALKDFTITKDTDSLKWKEHGGDLLAWLIAQAKLRRRSEKKTKIADELGISRNWLGQLRNRFSEDTVQHKKAKAAGRRRRAGG